MTPILVPLVISMASLGISEARFQPSADIWTEFAGSRYLPRATGNELMADDAGSAAALAGSAYPEAYRWNPPEDGAGPGELGGVSVQARAPVEPLGKQAAGTDPDEVPDHDFDLTPGVGLVGVGFVWRYR